MLTSINSAVAPSPGRTSVKSDSARSTREGVGVAGEGKVWNMCGLSLFRCLGCNATSPGKTRKADLVLGPWDLVLGPWFLVLGPSRLLRPTRGGRLYRVFR